MKKLSVNQLVESQNVDNIPSARNRIEKSTFAYQLLSSQKGRNAANARNHENKTCLKRTFLYPLLESSDLGFGLTYQKRLHMEFFDLESLF